MTVNYMKEAATIYPWTYLKILFRWSGSIWKSVFSEMLAWLTLYSIISLTYRIILFGTDNGVYFEELVIATNHFLSKYGSTLNFVAAFYISYINTRWWWLFMEIPWPDNLCMLISALMKSNGRKSRKYELQLRLAIGRYFNLAFVLLLRDICSSTKKRFPTLEHLIPLATSEEILLLRQADDLMGEFKQTCLYALPLDWIQKLIKKAGDDGNFLKSHMTALHEEVVIIRGKMYNLLAQDFICAIPISLTQVAIAAPVIYFSMCLIGKQFLVINVEEDGKPKADYIIPFYTLYEFIIYIGWMKAAMAMLNPFGTDDDDFEVDFLIDRNNDYIKVVLDDFFDVAPTPVDVHFNVLPQTNTRNVRRRRQVHPMIGSTANLKVRTTEEPSNMAAIRKIRKNLQTPTRPIQPSTTTAEGGVLPLKVQITETAIPKLEVSPGVAPTPDTTPTVGIAQPSIEPDETQCPTPTAEESPLVPMDVSQLPSTTNVAPLSPLDKEASKNIRSACTQNTQPSYSKNMK